MPLAQNWLILLKFDGSRYHGWQVQSSVPTVEETIEKALESLTGHLVEVNGAGRTDSGVHALNYTASFKVLNKNLNSPEKWRNALNALLPNDIVVKCVKSVPDEFHARHSSIGKRYRYLIYNAPYQSVFSINHSWWVKKSLNIQLMREAAKVLTGVHDFSTFRSVNCSSKNTIKNLREILITNNRSNFSFVQLEFEANSFLQHMVRILTGTLVEIGLGRKNIKNLERILKSGQRNLAGITAPSHGLYSLRVIYPKDIIEWPIEVIDN